MTRTLRLSKHHALGNDFLVVESPAGVDLSDLARRVCDRRRGIGADGLLVIHEADGYAARMEIRNADGTRAEMSGNGIRCFAQALMARCGPVETMMVLTDAGERSIDIRPTDHPATIEATVDMGRVVDLAEPSGWSAIGAHRDRPVAHLGLGNPHTVVGVDDVAAVDLEMLGRRLAEVNLEIVEPGPEVDGITMRVHERGVGITEACGTGACAAAVAARRWGLVPGSVGRITVHMPGGSVDVDVTDDGGVRLTGPATRVAEVEWAND